MVLLMFQIVKKIGVLWELLIQKELYTYGTKIYNNFIGWDTPQSVGDDYTNDDGEFGIG